jgi:transposase-like protein
MLQEPEVEQRYLAVREVLDTGANVNDVATRHGINSSR